METHKLEDVIAAAPFFRGLDPAFCATIAGCGKHVRFEKGQTVYRQGDPADTFYVVQHGHVALELPGAGRPLVHQTLHDNDILNAAWVVPPYRCHSNARAVDTTVAIAFDAACLRGKCDADHDLGYELMKRFVPIVVERLNRARLQALDVYGPGSAG
ncbi:cyclic nucleotide-binding domain-containing protein [Parvibaculum sedimenti]|uniref:Cyclic nucleotide-binding domain-containing protein n=1 Tax=Parvibaculum sedimenti TaxID=2608632 RepID=A0A6N6VFI9_9HYPH|nr:cyclic nucleotide-binding domain-containing protein [Parvibaculum sedimenti]KAB7738977.1 cyclic nucleotide-binding domain-containing protein [Parvibaculum sedimenti]